MYKHYLLCRYNLGLYSSNPYNVKNPEDWMVGRLPLFNRLLRSLDKQTNKNFTLLVALDYDTPDNHVKVIDDYLQGCAFDYKIIYDAPVNWLRRTKIEEPWLITSRIDNDDEYYPDFIKTIQDNFKPQTELLDVYGVQYDGSNYYSSGRPPPNSPFITLVEPSIDPKTVHHLAHSIMNGSFPARFAGTNYMYIQHIHDNNVMNKVIGRKLSI